MYPAWCSALERPVGKTDMAFFFIDLIIPWGAGAEIGKVVTGENN